MAQQRGRVRISGTGTRSGERINTVGLGERELDELFGAMDAPTSAAAKRVFARWRFRDPSVVLLLRHASGTDLSIRVACRNLSCGGASVLHNAYVHLDTTCTLLLPRRGGAAVSIGGTVVRCIHKQGVVHELGIKFNLPIRVRDFCGTGPLVDRFSFENVHPASLTGTALVVSASDLQHRMLQGILRETQVKLRLAQSCAAALEENLGSVDIVIADWQLPDGRGDSLLMQLRAAGCSAPVVLAIPGSMDVSNHHDGVAPEAYLRLPLKGDEVLRALAEFLLMPQNPDHAVGTGAAPVEDPSAALREAVSSLGLAMGAGDGIGCYSVCINLREIAETTSLGQVSSLASQAALALGESLDLERAKPSLEALLGACRSICRGRAG